MPLEAERVNEFYREKIVKARREHECVECRRVIKAGDSYQRCVGKDDEFFTSAVCGDCVELREALLGPDGADCDDPMFGRLFGRLLEDVKEAVRRGWERPEVGK